MMAGGEVTIQLRIIRGINLPKADTLSEIDPYIKFSYKGVVMQTAVVDNNKDPQWDEDFYLDFLEEHDQSLVGAVRLDLWDQNDFGSHEYCGFAVLDLTQYDPEVLLNGEEILLRITYAPNAKARFTKQGRDSAIVVAVIGRMRSFRSFVRSTAGIPGIKVFAEARSVYAEVPGYHDKLFVGMCWSMRSVDCRLCVTRVDFPSHVDISCTGSQGTTLRRTLHGQGAKGIVPGHVVFEEVSVSKMQLSDDFDQVVVTISNRKRLGSLNVGSTLADVGWKGPSMSFRSAAKSLGRRGCIVDKEWRCIYVPVDDQEVPEFMLLVDYSAGDSPSLKLCIMALDANEGRGFDFLLPQDHAAVVHINSEQYASPQLFTDDIPAVQRTLELPAPLLDDMLNETEVVFYALSNPQSWTLADLTAARGRLEGRQIEAPKPAVTKITARTIGRQVTKALSRLGRLVGVSGSKHKANKRDGGGSDDADDNDSDERSRSLNVSGSGDDESDGGDRHASSNRRSNERDVFKKSSSRAMDRINSNRSASSSGLSGQNSTSRRGSAEIIGGTGSGTSGGLGGGSNGSSGRKGSGSQQYNGGGGGSGTKQYAVGRSASALSRGGSGGGSEAGGRDGKASAKQMTRLASDVGSVASVGVGGATAARKGSLRRDEELCSAKGKSSASAGDGRAGGGGGSGKHANAGAGSMFGGSKPPRAPSKSKDRD